MLWGKIPGSNAHIFSFLLREGYPFLSNKVCVIDNILKSNKIARDSRNFEGKTSRLGMSRGGGFHNG